MCFVLTLAQSGYAKSSPKEVDALAVRLKQSKDFRVRTQAALALGTSASKRAVPVLCQALADPSAAVRASAAAALGRLKKGGQKCVRRRLIVEKNANVRKAFKPTLSFHRRPASYDW